MKQFLKFEKTHIWLLIIGGLGLSLFVALSLSDFQTIINSIPDDSFYYFQIASNFISGKGSSIDGLRTTNGYHPLWMIIISPLFLLKGYNVILPVRLVIILTGILTITTAYVLYRITMIITQRKILAVFAFGAYIFSGKGFLTYISGEPISLSNLLVVIGLLITLKIVYDENLSWRGVILLGIISGLTILSRTDNVVFVFAYFLLIFLWYCKERRFIKVGTAGLITIFTILPWLIWNLVALGTIKQTSLDACTCLYLPEFVSENQTFSDIFYGSVEKLLYPTYIFNLFGYSPFNIGLLVIIGAIFGVFNNNDSKLKKTTIILLVLTGIVFLLYLLHVAIMIYLRFWHIAIFSPITVLIIVCFIKIYIKSLKNIIIFITVLSVIYLIVFIGTLYEKITNPTYYRQIDMPKAAEYINKDIKHKYAVYDAGIVSYLTNGNILCIDGNVNPEAYRAVKEHRIYDYMVENNVDYLIGLIDSNRHILEQFWGYPFDEIFEPVNQNDEGMIYEFKYPGYGICKLKRLK